MANNKVKVLKIILVNLFTVIRLIGALILPFIYYIYGSSITSTLIILLFLTDAIDGFLARKLKVSTFFGSILDASSDKILNIIAFVILGIEYNLMLAPLIIEIAILYTMYSTYRYGGNVQASKTGKMKTIILDILVILSFVLLSLPTFNINALTKYNHIIINIFSIIILLACLITLFDYIKNNKITRKDPKSIENKYKNKKRKPFSIIKKQLFDIEYYKKHKDESMIKQFYM